MGKRRTVKEALDDDYG